MGAYTFMTVAEGEDAEQAFSEAVDKALWEHGHGGYTGTIAEKDDFVHIGTADTLAAARERAEELIRAGDPRIDDKWGPAGCIEVPAQEPGGSRRFLFFGWASS